MTYIDICYNFISVEQGNKLTYKYQKFLKGNLGFCHHFSQKCHGARSLFSDVFQTKKSLPNLWTNILYRQKIGTTH